MVLLRINDLKFSNIRMCIRPCLQGGKQIARVCKQKFTDRVTLLPGTTQTGLPSINVVNKHATVNKFSAKTYFCINYKFISSNKIIFHFRSSLKIPDTTFLKFGTCLTEKKKKNSVSEYFSDSSDKSYIENLVSKSRYLKIISF